MKNYLGLILAFIIPFFSASAFNEKDYKAFAQDIRQQVWSSTLPEFKNPKHTDRFTNHSAVILAAYEEFSFDKSNEKISLFLKKAVAGNEYWWAIGLSQIISNVPASIVLYPFSVNFAIKSRYSALSCSSD